MNKKFNIGCMNFTKDDNPSIEKFLDDYFEEMKNELLHKQFIILGVVKRTVYIRVAGTESILINKDMYDYLIKSFENYKLINDFNEEYEFDFFVKD